MKYCACIGIDTHSKKNAVFALDIETDAVESAVFSEIVGCGTGVGAGSGDRRAFTR